MKELKALKNSYDIICHNMNLLIKDLLDVYPDFKDKEGLNNLINLCQEFNGKATTASNEILIKMLE